MQDLVRNFYKIYLYTVGNTERFFIWLDFLTNDYLNGAKAKRKAEKNIAFVLADRSHPTTSHPKSNSTVIQI